MKIILAVDGSKYSRWAVDTLLGLPLAQDPEIEIIHVVDVPTVAEPLIAPAAADKYRAARAALIERKIERAQRLTAQALERIRPRWSRVGAIISRGRVAETILARAKHEKADLIIVGARGLSDIQRFLLGSVSQKLVTYAPCSVLVVKKRVRTVKRVLLAVDGSKPSDHAMRFLTANLLPKKLRATVLYVWEYPIHPHPESALLRVVTERYCEPLRRAGAAVSALWISGHAADKIVNTAARQRADLVVVGSRGLSALRRVLLGGISQKVVKHSRASVLVVR